jgi:alpha-glucosidase
MHEKIKFRMKRAAVFVLLGLFAVQAVGAAEHSVTSPNGRLKIAISTADGDKTSYSVSLVGSDGGVERVLISPSVISMAVRIGGGGSYTWGRDAVVAGVTFDSVTGRRTPLPVGKTSALEESYREVTIRYREGYSLVARAYNEGVAYRFVSNVPLSTKVYVHSEEANFAFAEPVKVWYPAMSDLDKEGVDENYERWYTTFESIAAINESMSGSDFRWCATPALFGFDAGLGVKVALTEADLHSYPTLYLKRGTPVSMKGRWAYYPKEVTPGNVYDGPKVVSREEYLALNTGSHRYPWRAIIVAEQDRELLTNQLVLKLSSPPKEGLDFSYVQPGKSTWEYWHDAQLENPRVPSGWDNISVEGRGFNLYREYVDFAARYGIEYFTIDTDGRNNLRDSDEKRLMAYADSLGVKGVKWNYIANIIVLRDQQNRNLLQEFKGRKFSCIKVDFFYRADQQANEDLEWLAQTAAGSGLTLLLHGCPLPHGLHRTYPNILSYEAVAGTENYKWDGRDAPRLPDAGYHVEIPFIRQLVGPMDYTPGSMRNVHKEEYYPKGGVPMSIGTRAHELAMYVMYDMFIAYLCDNPMEYGKHQEVMRYLSAVPVTWDESVALDGRVGEYALMAKRKGQSWYVAGMVSESPRALTVDFSFLAPGKTYRARILKDVGYETDRDARVMAVDSFEVTAADRREVSCVREGGFVMQLFEQGADDPDDPDNPDDPDTPDAPDTPGDPTAVNSRGAGSEPALRVYCSADSLSLTVKALSGIKAVSVVNVQGAVMVKKKYAGASSEEKVGLDHLPSGLYIVSVETASGAYATKFFK